MLIDGQIGWRGLSSLAGGVGIALALLTYAVLPPLPPVEAKAAAAADSDSELVTAESGQGRAVVAPSAASGPAEPL